MIVEEVKGIGKIGANEVLDLSLLGEMTVRFHQLIRDAMTHAIIVMTVVQIVLHMSAILPTDSPLAGTVEMSQQEQLQPVLVAVAMIMQIRAETREIYFLDLIHHDLLSIPTMDGSVKITLRLRGIILRIPTMAG
jgi:hypothetical protein